MRNVGALLREVEDRRRRVDDVGQEVQLQRHEVLADAMRNVVERLVVEAAAIVQIEVVDGRIVEHQVEDAFGGYLNEQSRPKRLGM